MNEFRKADAQLRAAIALMESTGVLNQIKAQAIEEVVKECISTSDDVMVKAKATQMMYYAKKLRGEK